MRMLGIGPFFQLQNHQKAKKEKKSPRSAGPIPNNPYGLCGRKATLNLNSVSNHSAQELCESGGGRPELPVPNNPYGLCGRKATLNLSSEAV